MSRCLPRKGLNGAAGRGVPEAAPAEETPQAVCMVRALGPWWSGDSPGAPDAPPFPFAASLAAVGARVHPNGLLKGFARLIF